MDQHPIPQDVTGFQFKLIGTMTVKQFGYVASGVVLAVIMYYLPIHSALGILMKVFLVPLFGGSGIIVAFVPIDGRPVDVMATNFFKALFSPNQYVYHKQAKRYSFEDVTTVNTQAQKNAQQQAHTHSQTNTTTKQLDQKEEKLRALLMSSHGRGKSDIDKKEAAFLNALTLPTAPVASPTKIATPAPSIQQFSPSHSPFAAPALQQQPKAPMLQPSIPSPKPINNQPPQQTQPEGNKEEELTKKESALMQELTQAKQQEATSTTPVAHNAAEQKVAVLSKQIQEIHSQKQQLEQELQQLQNQLASQKNSSLPAAPVAQKQTTPAQPTQDPQHVRVIPQSVSKKAGLPHVSDSPNVVVGIVKDPRGNILPNILVEVKDKDGNPVRAFKTNQLGQFASATPLNPGAYTIELEDPKKQQRFDVIQITANNQILLPIEVISHDAREELRKQLFTN